LGEGAERGYTAHRLIKGLAQDRSRFEKYLKPVWGDKEPQEIMPLEVDRLRLRILKDKAPQTAKLTLSLLRRIVNFGVKRQLCQPLSFHLEIPRVHNLKTEDLNPEQLAALLEALDQDPNLMAANFMKLALFTGMRRGELFRLQWQDLDFDRGFIHIRGPKGGQDQKIPLNQAARELLEAHPRGESPYIFPGHGGRQRTDINKQVNRIKEAAGLPKDFRALHGLRHVYASMLASSGQVDLHPAKAPDPQERRHATNRLFQGNREPIKDFLVDLFWQFQDFHSLWVTLSLWGLWLTVESGD
jgi:integrase